MQAIAQIKLSVHILANTLKLFISQPIESEIYGDENMRYFFHEAEKCLQNDSLNEEQNCDGPFWYLVRYIIRTFGASTLLEISNKDTFNWVLPYDIFPEVCMLSPIYVSMQQHVQHNKYYDIALQEPFMDQGAVYNPVYESIRSAITSATNGDFDELTKQIEVIIDSFNLMLNQCA